MKRKKTIPNFSRLEKKSLENTVNRLLSYKLSN